jgi:hypothetical protein
VASLRIIHIAPELPPAVGGVADYTAILSHRLTEISGGDLEPVFVHAGKAPVETIDVNAPVVDQSGQQSATGLADAVQQFADGAESRAVVLLEYSGYGYATRGAPLWLARGLSRVCGGDGVPLVTMIHEIRASNWKPWTSAFWVSPVQSYVAARIARLSRALVTNRFPSTEWVRSRVGEDTPVLTQPVFSNVGEPDRMTPFGEREPYAVVFGGTGMKKQLYEELASLDTEVLTQFGVNRIVDLGAVPNETLEEMSVETYGIQPATTVGEHLRCARIGLLYYPVDYLTKSGIWSSYAAHGLPSVVVTGPGSTETLEEGTHYIRLNGEGELFGGKCLVDVGRAAWTWYQSKAHSSEAARTIRSVLRAT